MFRFKRFEVAHSLSAHKVGVDGVLIGAWADCPASEPVRILDVGAGCGVISLMMAQRFPLANILGVDSHLPSVQEARENVMHSPWHERVSIEHISFGELCARERETRVRYDMIVSNPPYFSSGADAASSARMTARHCGELSPAVLLRDSASLLNAGGILTFIMPCEDVQELLTRMPQNMYPERLCMVRDKDTKLPKRAMLRFRFEGKDNGPVQEPETELLTMHFPDGSPTEEYRALCRDFYLAF